MYEFTKKIINEEIERLEEKLNNYNDEMTFHTGQLKVFKKSYEDISNKINLLKDDLEEK